jgi:molybdopterin-guanine dinucleotide biosynthesis protein A
VRDAEGRDIGPAAGLLAAYAARPEATLLVLAIDFPLASGQALAELVGAHYAACAASDPDDPPPVTCYMHSSDGAPEPFMSIWGPQALRRLKENVEGGGKTGPCFTAKQVWRERTGGAGMSEGSGLVRPRDDRWLVNANTPEQWEDAMRMAAVQDAVENNPVL